MMVNVHYQFDWTHNQLEDTLLGMSEDVSR